MSWWQAAVLGVVEGLTEYLPVSSTGHLILTQRMMGLEGQAANAYAICIQAGAILAVIGLYWQRVKQGVRGMLGPIGIGKGDEAGLRLFINLVVAFIPAAVIGLIADDWIEANLFNAWTIITAWAIGGVAIIAVGFWKKRRSGDEHVGKDIDIMTWRMALVIGLTTGSGAIFLYYYGLTRVRAVVSAICELCLPLSAVVFDYWLNGSVLGGWQWLGAVLLVTAITLVSLRGGRGGAAAAGG